MIDKSLKRIIYIEDEVDIAEIAKIALEDIGGFTLLCCYSGREALEKAEEFEPDLFIIDVMMPDMDGSSTFREIKKIPKLANIPVIFMTAKAQQGEVKEYLDMGVLGVIAKPFDPTKLSETISKIWNEHNE